MVRRDEALAPALSLAGRPGSAGARAPVAPEDARVAERRPRHRVDAGPRAGRVERGDELPPACPRGGRADRRGPRPPQGTRAVVEARAEDRRPDLLGAGRGPGVRRGRGAAREHDAEPRRGCDPPLHARPRRRRAQRRLARERVHRRLDGVRDAGGGRGALRVRRPLAAARRKPEEERSRRRRSSYVTYRALPQTPTAETRSAEAPERGPPGAPLAVQEADESTRHWPPIGRRERASRAPEGRLRRP